MDQIVLSLLPDQRLPEAIAGELGLDVVRPKRSLAYLLRHASRIAVLVAPENNRCARLYRCSTAVDARFSWESRTTAYSH